MGRLMAPEALLLKATYCLLTYIYVNNNKNLNFANSQTQVNHNNNKYPELKFSWMFYTPLQTFAK